jgi:hypothetical protein
MHRRKFLFHPGAARVSSCHFREMNESITSRFNKLVIIQVLGDAEAFFFDWTKLNDAQKTALIARHAAKFADKMAHKRKEPNWPDDTVPFALLGTSMPGEVQRVVDLSAKHEGLLLYRKASGRVLYVAASDDDVAYSPWDKLDQLETNDSFHQEAFAVEKLDFAGPPTQRTGFTLGQLRLANGPVMVAIGRFREPLATLERVWSVLR